MDWTEILDWFKWENLLMAISHYRSWGPLPGLALPIIEAFFPFLPLMVIIMANASAFGLVKGFLISWLGTSLGSLSVFYFTRKLSKTRLARFLTRRNQIQKLLNYVERRGFGLLFILYCFPFTPSSLVNLVSGLSKISIHQFALAVFSAKMVMVFMISFIGHDIPSLIKNPVQTAFVLAIILILWWSGKRVEKWLNLKVEREDYLARMKEQINRKMGHHEHLMKVKEHEN